MLTIEEREKIVNLVRGQSPESIRRCRKLVESQSPEEFVANLHYYVDRRITEDGER